MIRQELVSVRLLSSLHRLQIVRDDLAQLFAVIVVFVTRHHLPLAEGMLLLESWSPIFRE